jgi:chloramphenicol 3-O-phosphotransferase
LFSTEVESSWVRAASLYKIAYPTQETTLAKALQEQLSYPLYLMDVDAFSLMTPEKYNHGENFLYSTNSCQKYFMQ